MTKKSIRHKLASYLFYKDHANKKRSGAAISIDRATNIGIIYDSTSESNYELVKSLVKEFRDDHKDVLALGFYNTKELPSSRFAKLGLDYFTKKDLSWKFKPNSVVITNFIDTRFDILICLNIEKSIPLKYIASMSEAKFKIGRYDEHYTYLYDLMISVDESTSLKQYIIQTKYYLNQVKHEVG